MHNYNLENRLIMAAPVQSPPPFGSQRVKFVYDYMGRRIEKLVETWTDDDPDEWVETSRTRYVYDGWLLLLELDALDSNAVVRQYTWGLDLAGLNGSINDRTSAGGIGGLLAVHDETVNSGEDYIYMYDANGNVGQLVAFEDGYGGATADDWHTDRLVARYEYDAYGRITGPDTDDDGDWSVGSRRSGSGRTCRASRASRAATTSAVWLTTDGWCTPLLRRPRYENDVCDVGTLASDRWGLLAARPLGFFPSGEHWEAAIADTRIHGTTRQQVGKVFAAVERPALLPLPAARFPCFQEAARIVNRDGHVEVAKRSGLERGTAWWLRKAHAIGPEVGRWAETVLHERGIHAIRVIMGLVSLAQRHRDTEIEQACRVARSHAAWRLRDVRNLLKRQAPPQEQFEFTQEHPLIRSLTDYGALVHSAFEEVHA